MNERTCEHDGMKKAVFVRDILTGHKQIGDSKLYHLSEPMEFKNLLGEIFRRDYIAIIHETRHDITDIWGAQESGFIGPGNGIHLNKCTFFDALKFIGYELVNYETWSGATSGAIGKITTICQAEHCKFEATNTVPTGNGDDDANFCPSCYDAYIVGLNKGMGMIVELPEQMKRSRIAELLREIRHLVEFDEMMSSQRDVGMAFGIGVCSALNTDRRTTEQLKRILLINMEK